MPLTRQKKIRGAPAVLLGVFCLILGLAFTYVVIVLVLERTGVDPIGTTQKMQGALDQARTLVILSDITEEVFAVQFETNTDPPLEMALLIKWIVSHRPGFIEKPFVNNASGSLHDAWGGEIRLVVSEKNVKLASNGLNGEWDNGNEDDILGYAIMLIGTVKH